MPDIPLDCFSMARLLFIFSPLTVVGLRDALNCTAENTAMIRGQNDTHGVGIVKR